MQTKIIIGVGREHTDNKVVESDYRGLLVYLFFIVASFIASCLVLEAPYYLVCLPLVVLVATVYYYSCHMICRGDP